ncbi:carbamoyltransferase HypF [Cellulosilyticum sp. I15G10I2]|uniref:carbamoyltransferase HypF n=1 Tax=Cellulosilyticum sp. I15G10I2 TaxID=1892843 RepID=UPI00085C2F3F|nr:carbamoyltransferase HypF [Cellulosilyticum sp. I15G10I2]
MPAVDIIIKGIVQGVGFRPFVYQLAHLYTLTGNVKNSSMGVYIHLEGASQNINLFLEALPEKAPSLSKIEEILTRPAQIEGYTTFTILASTFEEGALTLLSPDIAICPDCLSDINNSKNQRRYQYAFTNCTNCGPRFSIIKALPYDRPFTTMQDFNMCPDCKEEYENPLDRRFHAQPTCCKICGPQLKLLDHQGNPLLDTDLFQKARSLIKSGYIIAVKGIGGFHLICDATSQETIKTLRTRKNRLSKPLALMMKDLGTVLQYCSLDAKEKDILCGSKKPILLLRKRNDELPYNISFDNPTLGIMLPYAPLHHMLFDEELRVLVATSANHSGMPMLFRNEQALEELRDIADYFLVHNRDIHIPVDDSVVKVTLGEERVIRGARGYAPSFFHFASSNVLAFGSELKNTFCLSSNDHCFMSQYIGDLDTVETMAHYTLNVNHFKQIYNINPKLIAYDYHPNFAYKNDIKVYTGQKVGIYHHHAHIASCMAENNVNQPVIGVAFDGVGYGDDGASWGSEFLVCDFKEFKRCGHLSYFKIPGGDMATLWPWRLALSLLYEAFDEDLVNVLPSYLSDKPISSILSMLKNNISCPLTCSMGRLFDGVAALLGFTHKISYEAEACIYLENLALAAPDTDSAYHYVVQEIDYVWLIDTVTIIQEIVYDLQTDCSHAIISRKFHNTMVLAAFDICQKLRTSSGIHQVALSGGVFQNDLIFTNLYDLLNQHDFEVLTHKLVPCNDSGLSLGQLVIASELIRK